MKIYYAHPMSAASAQSLEFDHWVKKMTERLTPRLEILDPERYGLSDEFDAKEIVRRNKMDVIAADFVLANLIAPSFGVASECQFAKLAGVPLIGVVHTGVLSAWVNQTFDVKMVFPRDHLILESYLSEACLKLV